MACFDIAIDLGTSIEATGVVTEITTEVVPTEAAELINTQATAITDTYAVAETKGATMPSEQTAANLAATVETIEAAGALTQYVAETYTVAESKGATMPTTQNAENLPATVESIEAITAAVKTREYAFSQVYSLFSAFQGRGITELVLPDEMPNLTSMNQSFREMTSTSFKLSGGGSLPKLVNLNYLFQNSNKIVKLTIDGVDFSHATDILSMFSGMTAVTAIDLSGLSMPSISISASSSSQAFWGDSSLEDLKLPPDLPVIGQQMIAYLTKLTTLTIPKTVTNIYSAGLAGNTGMKEYHFLSTTPPTLASTNVLTGIPDDCKIYVPKGSLEAYQTATNWATYADYMEEEP